MARGMRGKTYAGEVIRAAQLKLVGSSRGPGDDARIAELRQACHTLRLEDCVDFCINVPFAQLQQLLGDAVGGLHTMVDEHFGISVVEYMAAGWQLSPLVGIVCARLAASCSAVHVGWQDIQPRPCP